MIIQPKRRAKRYQKGQTIVESVICMLFLCLILFGLLQFFYLSVAQMILDYSAFYKAHCAAIGYYGRFSTADGENRDGYIINRCTRVAAIGASGALANGDIADLEAGEFAPGESPMSQFGWEQYRIPQYISGERWLNYEYWQYIDGSDVDYNGNNVEAEVQIQYPVEFPMKSAFIDNDEVTITGRASVMNYAKDFLE